MLCKTLIFMCYLTVVTCDLMSTLNPNEGVPGIPSRNIPKKFRLVGGKTAVDLTNYQNLANIQRLANAVVQSMNRNWYGSNSWALANVISATTQVVSGTSYDITFTVGQTVCTNNRYNPPNPNTCAINRSSSQSFCQCVANVWDRPWYNPSLILNSSSCSKVYFSG